MKSVRPLVSDAMAVCLTMLVYLVFLTSSPAHAQQRRRYSVDVVGPWSIPPDPSFGFSSVADINDQGHVLGDSVLGPPLPFPSASIWGGSFSALASLGGRYNTGAAINNNDDVVGASLRGGQRLGDPMHAWLCRGGFQAIDLFPGDSRDTPSFAWAINDPGQVLCADGGLSNLYDSATDTMTYLGFNASDINNLGQIAGSIDVGSGVRHAVLYDNGATTDLGSPGSGNVNVASIDDFGRIAGSFEVSPGLWHTFLYSGGVMHDLGTLGGMSTSAYDINDLGEIVGVAASNTPFLGKAFLYRNGTMIDLNKLLGPGLNSSWYISDATRVNNNGQIIGYGLYDPINNDPINNGYRYPVILTPEQVTTAAPEPGSLALVLPGLALVATGVRRRVQLPR